MKEMSIYTILGSILSRLLGSIKIDQREVK